MGKIFLLVEQGNVMREQRNVMIEIIFTYREYHELLSLQKESL